MYEEGSSSTHGSIVIHVEPLQSAFFAGESFSAKITFTNIAQPTITNSVYRNGTLDKDSLPQRPATATGSTFTSAKHKRSAQSITYGSAPLANPPTSPGTPHYSSQFSMSTPSLNGALVARLGSSSTKPMVRKGLVGVRGQPGQGAPSLVSQDESVMGADGRRRVVPKRSLSVDVAPSISIFGGASTNAKDELPPGHGSPRVHSHSPLSRPRGLSGLSNSSASPTVSSPLARSPSMPLPKSHPHARKHSVMDGHASDHNALSDFPSAYSLPSNLSAYALSSSSVPPSPSTSVSASSIYSSSLDPINEAPSASPEPPATEKPPSANRVQAAAFTPISSAGARLYSPKPVKASEPPTHLADGVGYHSRRSSISHLTAAIGLGQPPAPPSSRSARSQTTHVNPPPKTQPTTRGTFSSSFAPPNTEVLLWSYAQLIGTVELDDSSGLIATEALGHLRGKLNSLRTDGVFGGGRMDIGAPLNSSSTTTGVTGSKNRRSFISSLWGGGGSAPATPPSSPITSGGAFGFGVNALSSLWATPAASSNVTGFTNGSTTPNFASPMAGLSGGLPASALPTFETQPSLLAVDLNLAPGESRSYTYSVPLPAILPPTFRGKAMKFSYHLVLGSSRAESLPPIPTTPTPEHQGGQQSKIMRVPIRIYNHVSVERPSIPYDLLWPLARRRTGPVKTTVIEEPSLPVIKNLPSTAKRVPPRGKNDQFEDYITRLLALSGESSRPSDADDDTGTIRYNANDGLQTSTMSPSTTLGELDEVLSGGMVGCRENVEILTRVSRKMSYNITKESVKVAELTFVKSAFRVGETVIGLVEFNTSQTRARVLKVTAILEAHEVLPTRLGMSKNQPQVKTRALRRVHAQFQSSMVMDSQRISFSLDIPSDASPGFRVAMEDGGNGGLEWRVRMCFLVAMGSEMDDEGETSSRHLVRDGSGGDWGTSWKATPGLAPITRTDGPAENPYRQAASSSSSPWSLFTTRLVDQAAEDDVEGWQECVVETVECEVGITVWPGNTLYRPPQLDFNI
ncbi:hypothetical protein FRB94_000509 [Tulasnella sp. JGI-2019a]|nr:hypothetical protein FRB94_000509 [Tulasnella sp. JGI-2019a]